MIISFNYCLFFSFRFSFLCVVLVIRSLESPGELLELVGGLLALQSSWWGQRQRRRLPILRQVVEELRRKLDSHECGSVEA
jgi:hypothetical protein